MTVSEFYKSIFGQKVYKISLDAGCTCPNRDGIVGKGGCIFCSEKGSGDFVSSKKLSIVEQVNEAKKLLAPKLKNKEIKYIAYFQNFTNTYGNILELSEKWMQALNCQNVVGLAIGTRPDCISEECLKVLSKLAENFYIQVELGLQTTNPITAKNINRCYENETYFNAVEKLHKANPKIHIVTHVIFGLPGDNSFDMLQTVKDSIKAGTNGIKITCLYIVKGTKLAFEYEKGNVKALEKSEYYELLQQALKIIPSDCIIHRLTGDPPKKDLIAPLWTTDKKRVMNEIRSFLEN